MKRHSGKHKVLRALAAASGLGQLGARSSSKSSGSFYSPRIRINTKDLLKDPRKLAYLAVMNTAAELASSGVAGEGLTGAERSYIERSVSAFIGGKQKPNRPDGVAIDIDVVGGTLAMNADGKVVKLAQRKGPTAVVVCPHQVTEASTKGKALAANQFAARVMFNLLGTGIAFKGRKMVEQEGTGYVERLRYFFGPNGKADPRVVAEPDRCYAVEVSKELQARALENMAMNTASAEYGRVSEALRNLAQSISYGAPYGVVSPDAEFSSSAVAGLGEMDYASDSLAGVRRRRRKSSKRRVAKKTSSRRRSVRRKKK
jgi:hypothetical protein